MKMNGHKTKEIRIYDGYNRKYREVCPTITRNVGLFTEGNGVQLIVEYEK